MKVKSVKMGLLGCAFLCFLYSCEVERIEPAKPVENENVVDSMAMDNDNQKVQDSSSTQKDDRETKVIGTGSGDIIIKNSDGINYTIKPGTYTYMEFDNVSNSIIDGLEKVKVGGSIINMTNIENVVFQNLTIQNSSKSIRVDKRANNLTFNNINLINSGGFVFAVNKKYDGSESSYSQNIELINIRGNNIRGLFYSEGGIKDDGFYGLIKGLKIKNNTILNSPDFESGVYVNLAEDYIVSNNIIDNVNSNTDKHNGIFHMMGSGKIFNNKVTNHQGNAVRSWLFSVTKPNSLVEIYNNIVYNSRRYSAFEVQVTPDIEAKAGFKSANAKIYNNTVGKMNTGQPKYYEGRIVDIYQTFGSVEVFNNLYFDMRDDIVSLNQSNPNDTKVKETNNKYFENANDAVVDLKNFKSLVPGVGAKL